MKYIWTFYSSSLNTFLVIFLTGSTYSEFKGFCICEYIRSGVICISCKGSGVLLGNVENGRSREGTVTGGVNPVDEIKDVVSDQN